MKRLPAVPVQATAEERALVARLSRMARAGETDAAADVLATELQRAYDNGYHDGYGEGREDW